MQKIYCRKCGSEILRKNILGIGHFNENIGKYKGRSFVAFKCPVCKKIIYQFLDDKLPAPKKDNLIEGKLKSGNENKQFKKKQLLTRKKIDINQVISFYEKLKDIDKIDELLELLD